MNRLSKWLSLALAGATSPAAAAVVSAGPHGFEVRHQVQIVVPTAVAFASVGEIGAWWAPSHSFSGDASNLRLTLTPGGCLCERLPDGGWVEHMRVILVEPGKRVALSGALGPLLFEAVNGVMTIELERIAGGSRLTLMYRASGFANGGAENYAAAVDQVLAEQVKRLRAYATKRSRAR